MIYYVKCKEKIKKKKTLNPQLEIEMESEWHMIAEFLLWRIHVNIISRQS